MLYVYYQADLKRTMLNFVVLVDRADVAVVVVGGVVVVVVEDEAA